MVGRDVEFFDFFTSEGVRVTVVEDVPSILLGRRLAISCVSDIVVSSPTLRCESCVGDELTMVWRRERG